MMMMMMMMIPLPHIMAARTAGIDINEETTSLSVTLCTKKRIK